MEDFKKGSGKGCPVGYGRAGKTPATSGGAAAEMTEPPDTADRPLAVDPHTTTVIRSSDLDTHPGEAVPDSSIPSTGRGNSDDGQHWLNPSPYQLHRALKRKGKPIEKDDSYGVADVHEMVVVQSWNCIMEYENMYKKSCAAPKLARFEGRDGDYSLKAKMLNYFGVNLPFDRHDWTVDRCGTEVKYIIDYYDNGNSYWIDARPVGNVRNAIDRARLSLLKMSRGQSPW